MKTKITLLVLFVNLSLFGQIDTKVFKLDLSNLSINSLSATDNSKRLTLKSRELLRFQVVGGNPFKYKYVINTKPIKFFEEDNALFTDLINKANPDPGKTAGAKVDESATKELQKQEEALTQTISAVQGKITKLESSKEKIDNQESLKDTKSRTKQKATIAVQLKNQKEELARTNQKLTKVKNELQESLRPFTNLNSIQIIKSDGNEVDPPKDVEQAKNIILKAAQSQLYKIEALKAEVESDKTKISSSETIDYEMFKINRNDYNKKAETLALTFAQIKIDANLVPKIDGFDAVEKQFTDKLKEIGKILELYNKANLDNFSMPLDINGKNIDLVEVKLQRFDAGNLADVEENKFNIWIKGGFKIDVSGGIYITSLVNREYYIQDSPTSTTGQKVIKEKMKGNFDFGFGSSLNISHRSASWVNPTLNIGAMFTTNQQFQLLSGFGLILGKEERVIFSSGLSMGRITKIAQNFYADGETEYDLGTGSVPTSSVFDFGYYFGVTYNLSKTKKQSSNGK